MYTCLNPGAIGVALPWEACLPLAKANGFEGIDIEIDPAKGAAYYRDALAAQGLRAGGGGVPFNFRGSEAEVAEGLARLQAIAPVAAEVGLTRFATWILPFSDELPMQENMRFHAERLGPAARILAEHGCRLGLEFLGPKTIREGHKYVFAHTLEEMLDLCALVGPNAGLLLDAWHWYTSLGTLDDILALDQRQVVYVHINDAPAGVPVEQQQDLIRRLPGSTGVIDLPGFLHALRSIGYDGPVVPEPFVPQLAELPPVEAVRIVGKSLQQVWSQPVTPRLPEKMQAVAVGGRKAWLTELPVLWPCGNEVIVKIHASPICGSNMGAFFGEGEYVNVGHEAAGEVVAVAQSNLLKVGDRVVLNPLTGCGICPDCQAGDLIFCKNRPEIHGYFAQYTRITDAACVKLPDDIDYVHASLMGCGLGPAYEATKRLGVRGYDTLVVTGLGPVGLGVTALATFLGARVVAVDPEAYRRDIATKLGAAVVLDGANPEIKAQLSAAVGADGILKGVDCSGKEQAERLLIELAGIRAVIAFVGENGGVIPVSPSNDFIRKGLTLLGCWHMNILDAPDLFAFLRRAPEKADLLITHRFGFSQVQQAFDTFASRQSVKAILLPWE